MKENEIIIVGAGPAGCATAIFLAQKKIPHTLIEKYDFPRDKICGDAISGKSIMVLNKIHTDLVHNFVEHKSTFLPSHGCIFVAPNGKSIAIPFQTEKNNFLNPPGFLAKRIDFDDHLFKQINTNYTTIIQPAELTSLEKQSTTWSLKYKIKNEIKSIENIKLIVGADGAHSVVRKTIFQNQIEKNHFSAGVRAYYNNVQGFHEQNFIELHFLPEVLPGYIWLFPLANNNANVGIGMLSRVISKNKINLTKVLQKAIAENPTLKNRFSQATQLSHFSGWGLPLGGRKRPLSGAGFILTGDAASLIDPFTGEGIGNALYSGMIAADTIEKAYQNNNFSSSELKYYDDKFYKNQWSELATSDKLLRLCQYPWLFNFVVNKAINNTELQKLISCMFMDVNARAKLKDPMFYLKLLFS